MVLKNTKWDKKAKKKYLKKHGLNIKRQEPDTTAAQKPKWSSKKSVPKVSSTERSLDDSESDSEWDDEEDETLLNDNFPQISKQNLTKEQKIKIKNQLVNDLIKEEDARAQQEMDERDKDNIYLGSQETQNNDLRVDGPEKSELGDFLDMNANIPRRSKKSADEENILRDYGIDKHLAVRKKNLEDYNLPYYARINNRKLDDIPIVELEGFKIGESTLGEKSAQSKKGRKPDIRNLTEDEIKQETQRKQKAKEYEFYNTVKKNFAPSDDTGRKNKVLEINNMNNRDESLMRILNSRIINQNQKNSDDSYKGRDFDNDIDYLLGNVSIEDADSVPDAGYSRNNDSEVDDFIEENTKGGKKTFKEDQKEIQEPSAKANMKAPSIDNDFLNELLN